MDKNRLTAYVLRLADSPLILGQRLGEWCGHGPVLEQDIALTNIALDLIGEARNLFQYAAKLIGGGATEDSLAMLRKESEYKNHLLCELPNGDFAQTVLRQFFFDNYHSLLCSVMSESKDEHLAAIARKSAKEVAYHLRYSSEWVIRLGDGTDESHQRMRKALELLWPFTGELHTPDELDEWAYEEGIGPDLKTFRSAWLNKTRSILEEATLPMPDDSGWMQKGGRQGRHTEYMGFLLSELQMMQRTYPNMAW